MATHTDTSTLGITESTPPLQELRAQPEPPLVPDHLTREELEQVALDVRRRALAAGFIVDEIRATRTLRLVVAIRLREGHLLDPSKHAWVSTLFRAGRRAGEPPYPAPFELTVRSPQGVRIFWAGIPDGGVLFGGDAPTAPISDEPPPPELDGPTDLTLTFYSYYGDREIRSIACQPDAHGVPDAEAICRRLLVDRWQLFVPVATDVACGAASTGLVTLTGTFAGTPVSLSYGSCESAERWFDLFDIDPSAIGAPPTVSTS